MGCKDLGDFSQGHQPSRSGTTAMAHVSWLSVVCHLMWQPPWEASVLLSRNWVTSQAYTVIFSYSTRLQIAILYTYAQKAAPIYSILDREGMEWNECVVRFVHAKWKIVLSLAMKITCCGSCFPVTPVGPPCWSFWKFLYRSWWRPPGLHFHYYFVPAPASQLPAYLWLIMLFDLRASLWSWLLSVYYPASVQPPKYSFRRNSIFGPLLSRSLFLITICSLIFVNFSSFFQGAQLHLTLAMRCLRVMSFEVLSLAYFEVAEVTQWTFVKHLLCPGLVSDAEWWGRAHLLPLPLLSHTSIQNISTTSNQLLSGNYEIVKVNICMSGIVIGKLRIKSLH